MELPKEDMVRRQGWADLCLSQMTRRHVPENHCKDTPPFDVYLGDGSLGGEFGSIFSLSENFPALTHASRGNRRLGKIVDVLPVGFADPLGQQHVEPLAANLIRRVAE